MRRVQLCAGLHGRKLRLRYAWRKDAKDGARIGIGAASAGPEPDPGLDLYTDNAHERKNLTFLVHFVTHVIDAGGYAGIVALMGIESACIPLPSEIIMPFAGYLVYLGRFNLFWVATAGAVGCNLGSAVAYWIGAKGGGRWWSATANGC
jgi:hypothetical protein